MNEAGDTSHRQTRLLFRNGNRPVTWEVDEHGRPIDDPPSCYEIIKRARSALVTCLRDTPADLDKPARRSVIERRILEITDCLNAGA